MSRNRSSIDDGSLELLLDTICNTFGGIVFISFLVVLLLSNTSEQVGSAPAEPLERSRLIELENERASLTRQLERSRKAMAASGEIQAAVVSAELAESAARYRQAEQREARLAQDKSEAVGRANEAQERINEVHAERATRDHALEQAREKLDQIEDELESEIASRSEDAKIPRISATQLEPAVFFLKQKRLFGPIARADGSFNDGEFVQREEGENVIIEPNPAGGAEARPGTPPSAALRSRIEMVDPRRGYARIWIWNDSFDSFTDVVRSVIDEQDLKVQLIPLTDDDSIVFSTEGPPREAQ